MLIINTHNTSKLFQLKQGLALKLTRWDPELAFSIAELFVEENWARELEEKNLIIDRPIRFNTPKQAKVLELSKGDRAWHKFIR